jgi:hypothetical protein
MISIFMRWKSKISGKTSHSKLAIFKPLEMYCNLIFVCVGVMYSGEHDVCDVNMMFVM